MIFDNIKMAINSIKANKMRSFLTMLGIIIGISSVIMIVSVGDGAKKKMMSQFEDVGTTVVNINVSKDKSSESDNITMDDIISIKENVPHLKGITPFQSLYGDVMFKNKKNVMQLTAIMPDAKQIANIQIVKGRFINDDDYNSANNVICIDEMLAKKFFGTTDVVGMTVEFQDYSGKRHILRIVGVIKSEYGDFYVEGMPASGYMPLTTELQSSNTNTTFQYITVASDGKDYTKSVGDAIVNMLESRHNNRGRDVYVAENMLKQMDSINSVIGLVQTFIAAVAAISLLVGGIGVMNIMLVAVTERTREIGIRKSLGAKTSSIMLQFLVESSIMTFIGGFIGLVIGYLGSFGLAGLANISPSFNVSTIVFTMVFSSVVGLFFGIYPAKKAAKLNPIEALRHE
ncbi:MAG: ABC transporter permease [Oscillospiraceae bacterium]